MTKRLSESQFEGFAAELGAAAARAISATIRAMAVKVALASFVTGLLIGAALCALAFVADKAFG